MARDTDADDGESTRETKRFSEDVSGADLIEGDRIDPALIARTPEALGSTMSAREDAPETQLANIAYFDSYNDSHTGLLVDPETETIVRATRLSTSQAWSQKEADWTVREVGTEVHVKEVDSIERVDGETQIHPREAAQTWVDVLIGDMTAGYFDYPDEIEIDGSTLKLRDVDGREVVAEIEIVEGEGSA